MLKSTPTPRAAQRGFTLIEILVTILILLFGILGVFGMQSRAAKMEFESYQRGQALTLLRDMESRILSARGNVTDYLSNTLSSTDGSVYMGVGGATYDGGKGCTTAGLTGATLESCLWSYALQGVAEQSGGNAIGAIVGAHGCLIRVVPATNAALADIFIVVVWQGVSPGTEPLAASPAGQCASAQQYPTGLRRGASIRVMVPDLQKAS